MSLVIGVFKESWRVLAFALLAFSGQAMAVPQFDMKAYCKRVSDVGGGGSYSIEQSCRDIEAQAKSRLEAQEKGIPPRVMAYCSRVSSVGGGGSYSILESCITMELQAKRQMGQ